MLRHHKASAYRTKKDKIKKLHLDDIVFLYQSKVGIVAYGTVVSGLKTMNYTKKNKSYKDGEYYKVLSYFVTLERPLTAKEIKKL